MCDPLSLDLDLCLSSDFSLLGQAFLFFLLGEHSLELELHLEDSFLFFGNPGSLLLSCALFKNSHFFGRGGETSGFKRGFELFLSLRRLSEKGRQVCATILDRLGSRRWGIGHEEHGLEIA